MASLRLTVLLLLFVLLEALLLFSAPVTCDDEEDNLLQNINSYRLSLHKPALPENDNADCLADEIADELEDKPCPAAITPRTPEAQFSNYPKQLDKCHLNLNNTRDGVILLACKPGRVKSLSAFNFTDPLYSRFLNDSRYIGVGIGSEDDWIVVVLTTNTPGGSFVGSSAAILSSKLAVVFNLLALYWGTMFLLTRMYI